MVVEFVELKRDRAIPGLLQIVCALVDFADVLGRTGVHHAAAAAPHLERDDPASERGLEHELFQP